MKRFLTLPAICLLSSGTILFAQGTTPLPLGSSSPNAAAAVASRQESEENYNSLRGQIEDLTAAQAEGRKRIQELTREVEDLKMQLSKPKPDTVSKEDLRQLADTVQELAKKSQADKELVLKEFERLGKVISETPTQPTRSTTRVKNSETSSGGSTTPPVNANQQGYYYTVKAGDSLSLIVKGYRDSGVKVTRQQILDANPNLKPDLMIKGAKIFIPDASKK